MLQGEHSAIRSTFINLRFVIEISVLSIFEWLFYTGFTVMATFLLNILRTNGQNFTKFYNCIYIVTIKIGAVTCQVCSLVTMICHLIQ